jgi:hypothetical protein
LGLRKSLLTSVAVLLLFWGSCAVLVRPLKTRQGVNYRVTSYSIPAYVKALEFIQRHFRYQLLASTICAGKASDVDCMLAIFDWTHQNVPPTPAEWPVVDDHVFNIVIRGHGKGDQIADVFATLSTYAGMPAFWREVNAPYRDGTLTLAFVRLGGGWIPLDVENHVTFRHPDGQMARVNELVADPRLVDEGTRGVLPGGLEYSDFVSKETLVPFLAPVPLKADLQKPWPRLKYEIRRVVGWEHE